MTTKNNSINPLVTVAMVTYNSSEYVRMAIESVLASSYINFELIISDDCSTDNTWEIINEIKDPRIRAFQNETNLKEYPNRNRCIDLARGKYLIFIDGDDLILPHGLEIYVRYAESTENVGMIIQKGYFNNIIFPAQLSSDEILKWEYADKSLLSSSFSSNFFILDILRSIGKLDENLRTGDDEIRARIALHYPILFIPGWLTWPRETPGQASSQLNNGIGIIESIKKNELIIQNCSNIKIVAIATEKRKELYQKLTKEYIKAYFKRDRKTLDNIKVEPLTIQLLISAFLFQKPKTYKSSYSPSNPYYDHETFHKYANIQY